MFIRYTRCMVIENLDHVFREDYQQGELHESDVNRDPFQQFEAWFNDIIALKIKQPNSMVLSTSSNDGQVTSRVVLLKEFNNKGFYFYSDYRSKKAQQLIENPNASLLFFNIDLERQIRIEGSIAKISYDESNTYFKSRPKGSQISVLTSVQSATVDDRSVLENLYQKQHDTFSEKDIDCPDFWGGYCLVPRYFEFWQGRSSRLHDRITYELSGNDWTMSRLSP